MEALRLREALSFVPADNREQWVQMAMACKAALGDSAFEIWDSWSRQSDRYVNRDAKAVWRSVKAAGGITPGTLYAEAKRNGWQGEPFILDPVAEARRKAQRALEDKQAAEAQIKHWNAAAKQAAAMLNESVIQQHIYLARKGFPNEVGFIRETDLLIPMRSTDNKRLVSVQSIGPEGEKLFLKGGRARGSIFTIGSGNDIYFCEGYATGLSIHAALKSLYCKARVIVTFSAANLAYVASQLQGKRYVIADHDKSETGQKYALQTGLPYWMPPTLGMDANDFHQSHGVRALADQLNELRRQ